MVSPSHRFAAWASVGVRDRVSNSAGRLASRPSDGPLSPISSFGWGGLERRERPELPRYAVLARRLEGRPTPLLANVDFQEPWHFSRSTIDRIRKAHGLRSDAPADAYLAVDLLKILALKSISDRLAAWTLGTGEYWKVLTAPLLTMNDLKALDRPIGGHHAQTFRRRARTGKPPEFRLGSK